MYDLDFPLFDDVEKDGDGSSKHSNECQGGCDMKERVVFG
jgi:hypothetical protein